MKRAIDVGLFGELADPRVAARLAARAEERGWDGFSLDHITYRAPVRAVADPWVALAAVACATSRVRIGALVTPLSVAGCTRWPGRRPRWTCSAPVGSSSGPGSAARGTASWSRSGR